jgi:hypothetical protein
VITGRGQDVVRQLADEQIPVMGHLGFVPRKSTWVGGVRAVGNTSDEAAALWGSIPASGRCRRIRCRMRVDRRRGYVRNQSPHFARHCLTGLGRGRRRNLLVHLGHLRRGGETASARPFLGQSRRAAPGRSRGAHQGALRIPLRRRNRRLPLRKGTDRVNDNETSGLVI